MPPARDFPLLCPVCRTSLRSSDAGAPSLQCGAGHSFDAAKQGYFNFLVGKGTVFEADSADMVAARFDFLSAGHYQPLADAVAEVALPALAASPGGRPTVLDAGTGTGHYLRTLLDRFERAGLNRTGLHRTGLNPRGPTPSALRRVVFRLRPSAWTFPSSRCAAPPG